MDERPKHAHREALCAGGALHNSSAKLLTNAFKTGTCFSLALLLFLILLAVSLSPTPATAKSRGGCPGAGRLLFSVPVKQAWVKVPKLLPCPELSLSCFPVLANCGDVIIPLPWPQPSSQAGLRAGGNEVGSGTVAVFLTFTFPLSLNYSQTCELSKQGSSFLHKARFSPGLE